MMKMITSASPDLETTNIPKNRLRRAVHNFVSSSPDQTNKFDLFIMGCIVLNMILMAMQYENMPSNYGTILETVNYIFTAIFFIEAAIKLIAFGSSYFRNSWNVFDFSVVCASLVDIGMTFMNESSLKFLKVGP